MAGLNGHSNGHAATLNGGALGGGVTPGGRSSLRLLQTLVSKGQSVLDNDFEAMLAFARNLRDDKDASDRDRLRANELIATITAKAADKAVDLDKIERLDTGGDTERATLRVMYTDEASVKASRLHGMEAES